MPRSRAASERASGWRRVSVTVREASVYVAAGLIAAALYFLFEGLPIRPLPVNPNLSVAIQPSVVVPIFMGLTTGPLGGLLVGVGGRLLGDLLAGQGLNGFDLVYSGLLGFVAAVGYRRLTGFRNLGQVLLALACATLACGVASLASTLLLQTLIWREFSLVNGLNQTLSQFISGAVITLLLISTPLYVWGRTRREPNPPV